MTTDFFDREARAQKQTRRLVWLFGLTVLAVLAINNLLIGALVFIFTRPVLSGPAWLPFNILATALYLFGEAVMSPAHFLKLILHWPLAGWISCGTFLSIAAGSYYKMLQLSEGGSVVAEFLGGRRIPSGSTDADEKRLRNIVEEMAIASGTTVPEIYILDNERGINSFAAGYTRDDVAIGVTRGCLKLLTRDELQGVIAHEFSHVLNGDTRLNMKLMALAHGFFWPTILGRVLSYGSTDAPPADDAFLVADDETKPLPTMLIGMWFILLGSISLPFVRLIKSAICRQREWLADAAAVQFTRNPAGIAGALKKIGGLFKQGRLDSPHAEVASHLYFTDSNYEPWLGFLATHPPLPKRIAAIDPVFEGNFAKVNMLAPNQFEREEAYEKVVSNAMVAERGLPEAVLALASGVTADHIKQVSLMRLGLPEAVKAALRTPADAEAVIYSLLLVDDDALRGSQMEYLQANLAPDIFAKTAGLAPKITALGDRYKLVLAEFAVLALRESEFGKHLAFHKNLRQLIEGDGAIDLFEFTLMKMVARQVRAHFEKPEAARVIYGKVSDVLAESALLLSALAHTGSEDETEMRAAFHKGASFLDAPAAKIEFVPRNQWDLAKIDAALTRLSRSPEAVRKNILLACGRAVAADGQVTTREAELLRAIADALDCPMPPFVEALRGEELAKSG